MVSAQSASIVQTAREYGSNPGFICQPRLFVTSYVLNYDWRGADKTFKLQKTLFKNHQLSPSQQRQRIATTKLVYSRLTSKVLQIRQKKKRETKRTPRNTCRLMYGIINSMACVRSLLRRNNVPIKTVIYYATAMKQLKKNGII